MKSFKNNFIVRKLIEVILTLLTVSLISFILMKISPIDAAEAYARRNSFAMNPEMLESLREDMGLNKPIVVQYINWISKALRLDFGSSYVTGRDVFTDVVGALGITGKVVIISGLIQLVGALFVGCLSYYTKRTLANKIIELITIGGISIPAFFFAGLFIDIFAVKFAWMQVATNKGFFRYFPAAFCLAISGIAFFGQLLSTSVEKYASTDSALYARCRGISEKRLILFHVLPMALREVLPNFMQMLGIAMAGSMVVERIFSLPGLGYMIIEAILYRDSPVIHAVILFLGFALVFFNILASVIERSLSRGII